MESSPEDSSATAAEEFGPFFLERLLGEALDALLLDDDSLV